MSAHAHTHTYNLSFLSIITERKHDFVSLKGRSGVPVLENYIYKGGDSSVLSERLIGGLKPSEF